MSVEENQEPLPAIIRVRRKRTAPPSSGWMVSAKKNKVDENNKNLERPAIFKLAVTAADPSISNVSDLILPEKVAVVDYDREKGIIKQHGIIDEQQDQINTAAEMVEKMDVSDVPGPSSNKNKAPLASNESLDGLLIFFGNLKNIVFQMNNTCMIFTIQDPLLFPLCKLISLKNSALEKQQTKN